MWRFEFVAASAEPVTIEQARRQCNLLADEAEFDEQLSALISAARQHVEKVCGLYFGARTVTLSTDTFRDFSRLPVAPVGSVISVSYVDPAGADQTVPGADYDLVAYDESGTEPALVPVYGKRWPAIEAGSQITVTMQAGFVETPRPVAHAMLLWIADAFTNREPAAAGGWTTINSLLCNYRRGV